MNYLTPFYDKFQNYGEKKNVSITIQSNNQILTDLELYCKINCQNQISFSKATLQQSDNKKVSCELITHQLNQNLEYCYIGLWVNGSSDSSKNFDLSSNFVPYLIVKEPIDYQNISQVIFLKDQESLFSLNLTTNNLTNNNYSVEMIAEKSNNPNMKVICDFNNSIPICKIPTLKLSHVPMKLDSKLKVQFIDYDLTSIISINSFYFKDNVTFYTEYPFISNPMNTSDFLTIKFNVSQKLNPSYSFYCEIFNNQYTALVNGIDNNIFICSFPPRGKEEIASISLWLKNENVSKLAGIISNEDSNIELLSLKFDPPYVEMSQSQIFTFMKNDTKFLTIPNKYTTLKYKVFSEVGSFGYPCELNGGNITCNKSTSITGTSYDIGVLSYKLKSTEDTTFQDLVKIEQGLFLFSKTSILETKLFIEKNLIVEIRPLATLINSNVNITVNFQVSTLNIDLKDPYHLYCQHSNSGQKWVGNNVDNQKLKCLIEYDQHNLTLLNLTSFINVPTYTSDNLYISKNNYPFYYLSIFVFLLTHFH